MNPELIAVGISALVVLIEIARGRGQRHRLREIEQRVDVLLDQLGLTDTLAPPPSDQVLYLLDSGRKIDAIREYREQHPHLGLKGAKEQLEAVQRGGTRVLPADAGRVVDKLDAILRSFDLEPGPAVPHVSDDVRHLARAGRKLDAIRQLRHDNPGLGLAEARDTVERL